MKEKDPDIVEKIIGLVLGEESPPPAKIAYIVNQSYQEMNQEVPISPFTLSKRFNLLGEIRAVHHLVKLEVPGDEAMFNPTSVVSVVNEYQSDFKKIHDIANGIKMSQESRNTVIEKQIDSASEITKDKTDYRTKPEL